MHYSITLMGIYRKYLAVTAELISILERRCKLYEKYQMPENLCKKCNEFTKHAHDIIETFNIDLHKLIRLDYELKDLELAEKQKKEKQK